MAEVMSCSEQEWATPESLDEVERHSLYTEEVSKGKEVGETFVETHALEKIVKKGVPRKNTMGVSTENQVCISLADGKMDCCFVKQRQWIEVSLRRAQTQRKQGML